MSANGDAGSGSGGGPLLCVAGWVAAAFVAPRGGSCRKRPTEAAARSDAKRSEVERVASRKRPTEAAARSDAERSEVERVASAFANAPSAHAGSGS